MPPAGGASTAPRPGSIFSKNCPQWRSQQKNLWATVLKEARKLPGPARERRRTSIAGLLADERCSQAVLQFLATTDVGWTSGPPVAEDE